MGLTKVEAHRIVFSSIFTVINLSMVACGLQLFICTRTLLLYLNLPKDSESRKTKKVFIIALFVILFLFVTFSICYSFDAGNHMALHPEGISHEELTAAMGEVDAMTTITSITSCLLPVVGDGVLLYRCFVLYRERAFWALALPGVVYLALIGAVVASIVKSSQPDFGNPELAPLRTFVAVGWPSISMACNLLATGYLIYPMLHIRYKLSRMSHPDELALRTYTRPVAILVESAFPLALSAIATCAFYLSTTPLGVSSMLFPYIIWLTLTAMCPQLIIYRVIAGATWTRYEDMSLDAVSKPIVFAERIGTRPSNTYIDLERGSTLASASASGIGFETGVVTPRLRADDANNG